MTAYYNENDPYAAQWLRNLIEAGHIAGGDVDERSIVAVRPEDVRGYTQCHFFAGIGGWSLALRLAGWPDDRSVWTGSCPCQPFSAAGAGKAGDDERHLWPAWFSLIRECRPGTVFGEQVEAAIGWGWLDAVFADLEAESYSCGSAVLPACSVGAPHIRQRLWFVANASDAGRFAGNSGSLGGTQHGNQGEESEPRGSSQATEYRGATRLLVDSDGGDASAEGLQRSGEHGQQQEDGGAGELGHAESDQRRGEQPARGERRGRARLARASEACGMDDATGARHIPPRQRPEGEARHETRLRLPSEGRGTSRLADTERYGGRADQPQRQAQGGEAYGRLGWSAIDWLPCTDGKARPVEPGTFPLAHGIPGRVGRLRSYGNAIVPQTAAEFIRALTSPDSK